jgi:hypothetical protein
MKEGAITSVTMRKVISVTNKTIGSANRGTIG